jgi:hypothetical protein
MEIYKKDVSDDLIVAISQFWTVDYTIKAVEALRQDCIPFTLLILFDGTPMTAGMPFDYAKLMHMADIAVRIKRRINSLPHIWNIMFGAAKLTRAKYLLWQGSDMEFRPGSLKSMLELIRGYDIINPVKIDRIREKFDDYQPIYDRPKPIAGINDSAAMFQLDSMPFFPFEYRYAPYQFETSALGYRLWSMELDSVLDPNAVIFHYCSRDIQHSPIERELGSSTWDEKKAWFLDNLYIDRMLHLRDSKENREWFMEKSIMNSEMANKVGFPCYLLEDENG